MRLKDFIDVVNRELNIDLPAHVPQNWIKSGTLMVQKRAGRYEFTEEHIGQAIEVLRRPAFKKYKKGKK